MENLRSVELDCLNKSESNNSESGSGIEDRKGPNKFNENDNNVKEEKSAMRNLLESFNINGFVSTINYEDNGKKRKSINQELKKEKYIYGNERQEEEKKVRTPLSVSETANNRNKNSINDGQNCQKYNTNETHYYNNTVNIPGDEEKRGLFDRTYIDLDNETKNLEEWDETQKKIYDPTIGLRRHYTSELLSCGEKNDIHVLEKWSSMINRDIMWFIKNHRTTYLRRVKRGIPQKYRWKIWVQITNAKPLISKFRKKYYFLSKQKSSYTNLILIDISRTFPELIIFDKYAQQQLYRILNAYSNYEPSVGYCQGMNFVVGLLLLVSNFDELETFCVLVSLMNNYHLQEFYKEKFPLLNKYIYVFEKILQNEIPDLVEHFNKEEVFPPVYLHQWMLTLFIASLPIKSVIVIWDFLFSTSVKMIIFIAVALLKILKTYLMKHKFEKILKLLKSLKYNESNDDILIAKLLIKKSDAITLSEELKFLFENIEQDNIIFNHECKYSIENITNYHFNHIQNNQNNSNNKEQKGEEGMQKIGGNESEEFNFVQLDGTSLLNFFSNSLLKKTNEEEELKITSNLKHTNVNTEENRKMDNRNNDEFFAEKKKPSDMNTLYYKMVSESKKEATEKEEKKEEKEEEEEEKERDRDRNRERGKEKKQQKDEEEEEEEEEGEEEGEEKEESKRKKKKQNQFNYNNDNYNDNDESEKTSSRTSDKYFFGKSSTKDVITTEGYKKEKKKEKKNENEKENAKENENLNENLKENLNEKGNGKITIHLNKRIETEEKCSDNMNNYSSPKLWKDSYDASAKKDVTYCAREFIASPIDEQIHEEESSKYVSLKKKKKSRYEDNLLYVNNDLNCCNYLSDNSHSSKNMTKSSLQLDRNHDGDHLYKSDSFVETYQKGYKNEINEPLIYDFTDEYSNEQDYENEVYDLSKGVNIYPQGRRKIQSRTSNPPTTKSLTIINIETMQRKSDGHIKRHAYYNRNVNKQDSYDEEKTSEHIIKTRMNKYEHKLNAKEKLEMDKYKDMTRKLKKEREERERIEREREKKREEERKKEEDESVLNISHYIQSDENEQKNNDNNFNFFNMIQAYTKDNNWFDVSTINKYYQFNKSNMDYELDDINYNQNTKQRKDNKREDDDVPF